MFGCVVKAMWCNPVKMTDFWKLFLCEKLPTIKNVPSVGSAAAWAAFVLYVAVLQAEKPYLSIELSV